MLSVRHVAAALLAAGIFAGSPARGAEAQPESWIVDEPEAPAEATAAADDVKVIARYDFEDGLQGWKREEWEEYKPWNEVSHSRENAFQGSRGALKTTTPNTWSCLGPLVDLRFREAGTKVSFAYYGHNCTAVHVQCWSVDHDKNMHFTCRPYREKQWDTHTAELAKLVTWGGNSPSPAGNEFRTVQVFSGCRKGFSDTHLLLDNIVVYNGTDKTPPGRASELSGRVDWDAGSVVIGWKAPADNVGVARFHIHRSTRPDFAPSARNRAGMTADVSFADGTVSNFGVFYYRVVAEDYAGNFSPPSRALAVRVVERD
jgi:hypothetical protein